MWSKRNKIILLALVLLGFICIGLVMMNKKPVKSGDMNFTVHRTDLTALVSVTGKIAAQKETLVSPPYSGYIQKLFVKVGEYVKRGQPLVSVVQSLASSEKVFPIRAPYAGRVVAINGTEGMHVDSISGQGSSANFILKVDDLSHFYVKAKILEGQILRVKPGQKVLVKLLSNGLVRYHGIVQSVSMAPVPQNSGSYSFNQQVAYSANILVTDANPHLLPGLSVVCDIFIKRLKHVIAIPSRFIRIKGQHHYVVLKNGQHQSIKLGMQAGQMVQVVGGLKVGQKIKPIDYFKSLNGA